MKEPLISVIVPVYKAEQYLERCVDSILMQTYSNLELILIDDGSPDKCPEICDQYAAQDARVKVVHKKNGGVSSARNAGLERMVGEYVSFVDSDDCIPADALMNLCRAACEKAVPYVVGICGIDGTDAVKNPIGEMQEYSVRENPEALLKYIVEDGSYSPYAKLYDARLIRENQIRFREDMRIAEDTVFLRNYLIYCDSICVVPYVVYLYTPDNAQSLSKKYYEEYGWLYGEKMKAVEKLVSQLDLPQERKAKFISERGINGIKISVDHYFRHSTDKNECVTNLEKTAQWLLPWVDSHYDGELMRCNAWWKKHCTDFRKGNYYRLYFRIAMEKRYLQLRAKAGKVLRAVKGLKKLV